MWHYIKLLHISQIGNVPCLINQILAPENSLVLFWKWNILKSAVAIQIFYLLIRKLCSQLRSRIWILLSPSKKISLRNRRKFLFFLWICTYLVKIISNTFCNSPSCQLAHQQQPAVPESVFTGGTQSQMGISVPIGQGTTQYLPPFILGLGALSGEEIVPVGQQLQILVVSFPLTVIVNLFFPFSVGIHHMSSTKIPQTKGGIP